MLVSLLSWALRVIAVVLIAVCLFVVFGFGVWTLRLVGIALYGLTLAALIFGCAGKSLVKRVGRFFVFGLPFLVVLGGGIFVAGTLKSRMKELAAPEVGQTADKERWKKLASEEGEAVFKGLYERGECKAFSCQKKMTGLLFSMQYLVEEDKQISEKCRVIHNASSDSEVLESLSGLAELGIVKRLERLVNTKVPAGMERDFVWCHIARGMYGWLGTVWTGLFWLAIFISVGVFAQGGVAILKSLRRSSK